MRAGEWDHDSAEYYFRRAINLEPSRGWFREQLSHFYLSTDRPAEALVEAERGLVLEPFSPSVNAELARALCANGRVAEGLARLVAITTLDPPLARAAPIEALCHARQQHWSAAVASIRPSADRGDLAAVALLGYLLARAGERTEALAVHERLTQLYREGSIGAYYLSFVPSALKDHDQAFAHLDRAMEDGSIIFAPARVATILGLPFTDLKGDPRYTRFRTRIGLQNR
jgi:tetratricopeptide (TPR) repeat protein